MELINGLIVGVVLALLIDRLFDQTASQFLLTHLGRALAPVWRWLAPHIAAFVERPAVQLFFHGVAQLLLALDQLLNVMSNPFSKETWCDETLSARCGRLGHRYPYKFWKAIIDWFFGPWQGPNHCVNAYEKEKRRYNCPPEMRS